MMMRIAALLIFASMAGGDGMDQSDKWKHIVERFAPTDLGVDLTTFTPREKQALFKFVQAARIIDEIFWDQTGSYVGGLRTQMTSAPDNLKLAFAINYGPYDEQAEDAPFFGDTPRLPGASFYPSDMTREELQKFVEAQPDLRSSFESPYTAIERDGKGLKAVPFHNRHLDKIEKAARYLEEACAFIDDPALAKYVRQRAADLRTDDYYKSDSDWIDLKDNRIEIVIGPYEVYEDKLLGLKAAYEAYVYCVDREGSAKLSTFVEHLPYLQSSLPMPPEVRQAPSTVESPLRVVNLVFSAGDARQGVQTVAFNLPNDEKVREEKGSKKVMLKNLMRAKFDKILVPMARTVLGAEPAQAVQFDPFFNNILLHEISHALGVTIIQKADGTKSNPNVELKELYGALEEAKADVVGLYTVGKLMEKKVLAQSEERSYCLTFVASMFRSIRFGVAEAHGMANIIQLNWLAKEGGISFDAATGAWSVDTPKVKAAMEKLAQELLRIQYQGDYAGAQKLIAAFGTVSPEVQRTLAACGTIPVDIRPVFAYDER